MRFEAGRVAAGVLGAPDVLEPDEGAAADDRVDRHGRVEADRLTRVDQRVTGEGPAGRVGAVMVDVDEPQEVRVPLQVRLLGVEAVAATVAVHRLEPVLRGAGVGEGAVVLGPCEDVAVGAHVEGGELHVGEARVEVDDPVRDRRQPPLAVLEIDRVVGDAVAGLAGGARVDVPPVGADDAAVGAFEDDVGIRWVEAERVLVRVDLLVVRLPHIGGLYRSMTCRRRSSGARPVRWSGWRRHPSG